MSARPKILVTQKVPDPAYPLLQAIGDDARDGIDAAAGRNADDDPDRPVGIVGRGVLRGCARRVKQSCGNQSQNSAHVILPSPRPDRGNRLESMAPNRWRRQRYGTLARVCVDMIE